MVDHRMHLSTRLGRLTLLVGEAHVAVLDRALRHLERACAGLVLNVGRGGKHLVHAAKSRNGLLEHLR